MNVRQRLPNRRSHELINFTLGGFTYIAGIGRFDDGSLAEIFLDPSAKSGTAVEAAARDAAITASIALQHGTPAEVIRSALSRDHFGAAAGPLGAVLDLLAEDDEGHS